ncbi:MAG: asparagine synthase (glutamine-hydrolyzing) [Kiloniellaceae bacterium]
MASGRHSIVGVNVEPMCGIFAMFLNRALTPDDLARGRQATLALAHRGPDAQGEWFDKASGVFLGHRRLSIIDLSAASDQPFCRGSRVLTYNGEIYNYEAIRQELIQRGVTLTTGGDTEVLMQALATFGLDALDRLDGMFAFALWDGSQAHLAVDPFGEKPLYIAENAEGVYVASELAPLIDLLDPEPDLDGENFIAFLALGYLPSPRTAWRGIRRLSAGHHASVSQGRLKAVRPYWRPPLYSVPRGSVRDLTDRDLDRIRDTLTGSLEGRYVADVPLCLFLSAGIDSSLLAALSVHELHRHPECVTVAFPGSSVTNEAPLAAATASYLGLPHRSVESLGDPAMADDAQLLDLLGQPNDNLTVMPIQQMCAAMQSRFKVGLTGMGGDEVFLGYGKHHLLYRNRHWRRLPDRLRRYVGSVCAAISPLLGRDGNHLRALLAADHELYLGLKNTGALLWLREQPGFDAWARSAFEWEGGDAYLKASWYEIAENMQCSQLPAIDHGSMRASMELRTPFLSRELVDLVAEFDPRAFMATEQKAVLRRLLKRYLPDGLVMRSKEGFRFPPDHFVKARTMPRMTAMHVSSARISEVWSKRREAPGWARICVRLALAEAFLCHGIMREPRGRTAEETSHPKKVILHQ